VHKLAAWFDYVLFDVEGSRMADQLSKVLIVVMGAVIVILLLRAL
jgi:hypothetical protein